MTKNEFIQRAHIAVMGSTEWVEVPKHGEEVSPWVVKVVETQIELIGTMTGAIETIYGEDFFDDPV